MGAYRLHLIIFVLALGYGILAQEDKREPPSITQPEKSETKYHKNGTANIRLSCKASGTPQPEYQWRFEDQPVTDKNPPGGRVTYDSTTGDLTITLFTVSESGVYQCRASNQYATALAPRSSELLSELKDWPDNPARGSIDKNEGDYTAIECDPKLPTFKGNNNFKWYRRSETASSFEVKPDGRIFIDEKGTLHFTYVMPSDDTDNLLYSCALYNAESGKIVMGEKINLNISPASMTQSPPVLKYSSVADGVKGKKLVRGKKGQLECFFSGNPSPTVSWKDEAGNPIQIVSGGNYQTSNAGRILIIENVQMTTDTSFTCVGTNSEGTTEGLVKVDITSPPMWVVGKNLTSQTVPEVQNVVFNCEAVSLLGEQAPSPPVWYKNGVKMPIGGSSNYVFTNGRKQLTLMDVTKEDGIACYQCEVTNHVGTVYGQGCLNVLLPINITTRPPETLEVSKGDVINLTVIATSDPLYPVKYEWLFRNVTYTLEEAPPYVTYNAYSLQAFINTSKLTDEGMQNITGVYRRLVYHAYQRKEVYVTVKLKIEPGPAAAGFQFWIIGLIIALLIILIVLIICCCVICRRKMQEGDYPVDKKETAAGLDPEKEVKDSAFPDLSRAQDPYQQKKPGQFDMDGHSIRDDESFGSAEYGGDEPSAFNEDGSFIGAYKSKDKQPVVNPGFQPAPPPPSHYNYSYPYDSGNESRV